MGNGERQRLFLERNPGYYQRLHAKRRAATKARAAAMAAQREFVSVFVAQLCKAPLMLPAPVETIVIPGVNAIPTRREEIRARIDSR